VSLWAARGSQHARWKYALTTLASICGQEREHVSNVKAPAAA